MEDFDLEQFFRVNDIEVSDSYKNQSDAIVAFDEIREILVLRKIAAKSSFTNKIYLNILIKNSPLYSHLNNYSKVKNKLWTCFGRFLGFRI